MTEQLDSVGTLSSVALIGVALLLAGCSVLVVTAVSQHFGTQKGFYWKKTGQVLLEGDFFFLGWGNYTSIAARGGGGSFKRLKLYNSEEHVPIESFVTTLIHWTFFSDDANKVGICWLCRSGQLHVTPSSRWSLPRCHRSVRNDMRLFLRTKQYPIQLRTTKFWKVLPQYYSVLQSTTPESTTPVLLRTTKYYSSTTPYYKVLVQYYSVLQSNSSTSPVLQSTTPVHHCI